MFIVLVGSSDYMCEKDKKTYVFQTLSHFKKNRDRQFQNLLYK